MKFQHSKQKLDNIPEKGFLVYNEFTADRINPTLKEIIDADLLNEDYFNNEAHKKVIQEQLNKFVSMGKSNGSYLGEDKKSEPYGPLLKNKIQNSDFLKLDYPSYLNKMVYYIKLWTDNGWTDLVEALIEFHQSALEQLIHMSPDKREYYFLDADFVKEDKLFEVNWYAYFSTVISTLSNSDTVVIMNFGND